MIERVARKLDFSRQLLLGIAAMLGVGVPVVFGMAIATPSQTQSQAPNTGIVAPSYGVVSIKANKGDNAGRKILNTPDGLTATAVTMQMAIRLAYPIEDNQVVGAPKWFASDEYDIEAKMDSGVAEELRKLAQDERNHQRLRMFRAMLADRFKLTLHRETRELPAYTLVIAKNGPKFQKSKPDDISPSGIKAPDGRGAGVMKAGSGDITGQALPMANLAEELSNQLGRPVMDKTGLTGPYDFSLRWTPDEGQPSQGIDGGPLPNNPPPPESSGPSIFTAIQEQLGLKLESKKGPVDVLVIDHVEKPSGN